MRGPRRAGPLASLSVLGAGTGWGALTGVVAGTVVTLAGAGSPSLADVPPAVALGLLFGSFYGGFLGLGLAFLPAMAVAFVRSPRQGRLAGTVGYVTGAALLGGTLFHDGFTGRASYVALYGSATAFGLWRCQRSAALAVERVARRRAAAPVQLPGVPLTEPSG